MPSEFGTVTEIFYSILFQIPVGRFTTYGRLAEMMPVKINARQVARLLSQLPKGTQLPWHRVVNSQFKLANFGGHNEQAQRLKAEGLLPSTTGRLPANKVWPDY